MRHDTSLWLFFLVLLTVAGGWLLTALVRRRALAQSRLDVPNARSSHTVPTPRGGGLAFVLALAAGLLALAPSGLLDGQWRPLVAVLGAGVAVAVVGFLDDRGHVPARWRLLVHFSAAAWGLAWLGGPPALALGGWVLGPNALGWALAAFYLVWLLNLYNFMDGIDGLAAAQAITVGAGAALLYGVVGAPTPAMAMPLALAGAVAGFLLWNFPPARIFMGDVGSGFLGIVLGLLSLQAGRFEPLLLWAWLILQAVFVTDATLTLLRRLLRGERVYEAHRLHAYQHLSRRCGRHLPVTLAVLLVTGLYLLPLAWAVAAGRLAPLAGLALAYLPLAGLALMLGAGRREAVAS